MTSPGGNPHVWDLALPGLEAAAQAVGLPKYRSKQVYEWLHKKGICDPGLMANLPKPVRDWLSLSYDCSPLALVRKAESRDGSIKYVWMTPAGNPVESVLMPGFDYGTALCISCQSGCTLHCRFCQTGRLGLRETLTNGMILAQLYQAEQDSGLEVDRLVLMGMGEPLFNLAHVLKAIEVLCGDNARNWSPRRITLSTVGLYRPMLELAAAAPRINLAVSLHFTEDSLRKAHMPGAEASIAKLATAMYCYRKTNGGKITIEYALIDRLNDSDADAKRLAAIARLKPADKSLTEYSIAEQLPDPPRMQDLPVHVNLLAYNPIGDGTEHRPAGDTRVDAFARLLRDLGVPVTVRHSRGQDIGAACGQLGKDFLNDSMVK